MLSTVITNPRFIVALLGNLPGHTTEQRDYIKLLAGKHLLFAEPVPSGSPWRWHIVPYTGELGLGGAWARVIALPSILAGVVSTDREVWVLREGNYLPEWEEHFTFKRLSPRIVEVGLVRRRELVR